MSVPEYLRQAGSGSRFDRLPEDHPLRAYPEAVAKAWHLSLDQLEQRSAAAARLLGICSVMAPEISLDLIYSEAMVSMLRDLDRRHLRARDDRQARSSRSTCSR